MRWELQPPTNSTRPETALALASTLFHVKGYTSAETVAAFERANEMIEQADALGEPVDEEATLQRYSMMYGLWTGQFVSGQFLGFKDKSQRFLALAERQALSAPLLIAHRVMGATCAVFGELTRARLHLDKAVDLYNRRDHSPLASRFGQDIGVAARAYRAFVLYRLGFLNGAQKDAEKAIESGRELGQVGTLIYAIFCAALVNINCGRLFAADEQIEELSAMAEKYTLPYWKACGGLLRGEYYAATDYAERAVDMLDSSLETLFGAGTVYLAPQCFMWQARAYACLGRYRDADNSLKKALEKMDASNERWDESEIRRTAGELSLLRGKSPTVAKLHFLESLEIARKQEAKLFELRALVCLAKISSDRGPDTETIEALANVCDWFTEGRDSADFRVAYAILGR